MKLSPAVAIGVIVLALVLIVGAGVMITRRSTGADVVDQMHRDMESGPSRSGPPIPAGASPQDAEKAKQRDAPTN